MPLEKKDAPANKASKAEKAAPAEEPDPRNEEHPGDVTPGMYAEEKVGAYEGEPGTPEANEHGEKFLAAKMEQRLGTAKK